MSVSIRYEAQLFLMSICTGGGLVMVYDCVRFFRMVCPHKMWVVGAEDLVYGFYCAVMTFSLLYQQNDGNLRGFSIGGVIMGMTVYQYAISRKVLKRLQKAVEWIKMKTRKRQNRFKRERK
ncbi:MAG: spore cortex biosynthesis protein YabQ [Hungatella sp.]|jgi:hypothetical protein|nr:spore cortex biosynthesis protein YabQ [Hungatella sp.]